jgi:hypothetical protein
LGATLLTSEFGHAAIKAQAGSAGKSSYRTPGRDRPPRRLIGRAVPHGRPGAYGDVVMALSIALRIKRTLHAAEIDKIISDMQALKARAIEHRRRADWRKRELAAASFHAECHHPNAASPSHFAPDRLG